MPNRDGVEVKGLDDLQRGTEDLAETIAGKVPQAAEGPARALVDRVRAQVPKISGAMAGDLDVIEHDGTMSAAYLGGVEYVGWVEFGGTRGRPYLADGRWLFPESARSSAEELERALGQLTEDEIRGHRWPAPT